MAKIIGVYKITNIVNNKVYIGSSFNIKQRWNRHLNELRQNIHHSSKLQRSFNIHGKESFIFEIIEECDKNIIIEREQYWINSYDSYHSGYNEMIVVNYPMLGKNHSIKTKNKMSEAHKGKVLSKETKEKLRDLNLGKKISQETKKKISKALKGKYTKEKNSMWGKSMSQDVKNKLIEVNNKKIVQYNKNGDFIKKWGSISECAKTLNLDNSSITKVCRGKLKTTGNFTFKYE